MASRLRARAGISLLALLAGVLWVVVPALPAAAATTLTVTPNTGLTENEGITIAGTGWVPGGSLAYCQAVPAAPVDVADCANGEAFQQPAGSSGSFSFPFSLQRLIRTSITSAFVDCADPSTPCVIAVAEASNPAATVATVTLNFALPPPPTLVPVSTSTLERNSGTSTFQLPIGVKDPNAHTITMQWRTVFVPGAPGDQADPATDYVPTSGTLTIAPAQGSGVVPIVVNGDNLVEPDEYIIVQFANPTNAVLSAGTYGLGSLTIRNDDHAVVVPGSGSVLEGSSGTTDLTVPVTLSNPSTQTVTAQWRTVYVPGAPGDQADPATDYTPASGTVTFAPGQTAQTVTVSVNGDTAVEPDEYVVVEFGNVTNAKIGGVYGLGSGTIVNDD